MTDHPKGAILQRDKETYAIVPRTPVGIVTPDDLESLAKVARKYHRSDYCRNDSPVEYLCLEPALYDAQPGERKACSN